jgi:NADPH2:quinone reductase
MSHGPAAARRTAGGHPFTRAERARYLATVRAHYPQHYTYFLCLAPLGYLVLYGQASGPVAPFDPAVLSGKGSLFLTRPTLGHYTADRVSLEKRAGDVLGWIAAGKLKLRMEHNFALRDAAKAHESLEGRQTTGKVLLIP